MTVVEIGPDRLAKLHGALGDMDEALRDEGFDASGSHAVYVRWQRACVEALGAIVVEAGKRAGGAGREGLATMIENRREVREAESRRIERMMEAGGWRSIGAGGEPDRAGDSRSCGTDVQEVVGRIAEEMSRALVEGSQQWLILNRRSGIVNTHGDGRLGGGGGLAVFFGGCVFMQWWSAKESAAHQAVLEAVDRCWVEPRMVRMADGKTVEMCRLADLTTDRPN